MSHILIIEDEQKIAQWVAAYLERAGYTAVICRDGAAGLAQLRHQPPDLLILDLNLPSMDGLAICQAVRAEKRPRLANLPIIMLTARVEEADKLAGLGQGADDYVTKPFSPKELVARVQAMLRRQERLTSPSPILEDDGLVVNPAAHQATLHGRSLDLTPSEFAVLVTLMHNSGRALSRSQLIEQALGHDYEGQERSIDVHIRQLRRKLETNPNQPERLQTVFGIGYRWRE